MSEKQDLRRIGCVGVMAWAVIIVVGLIMAGQAAGVLAR